MDLRDFENIPYGRNVSLTKLGGHPQGEGRLRPEKLSLVRVRDRPPVARLFLLQGRRLVVVRYLVG